MMKKYIKIMRIDHWIKQLFIVPGIVSALLLSGDTIDILKLLFGFFSTCLIASANYVINEYFDAEFDKFHPTKKHRCVVEEGVHGVIVFFLWCGLTFFGFLFGFFIAKSFLFTLVALWLMGIFYNLKPIRTKDIPFIDVLSESINNPIRFLLGWFLVSGHTLSPSSVLFGYWMGGAFLMAIKRYAEYRMIANPKLAGQYRKSFCYYTEHSLLISSFFYSMCSVFFIGIFFIKYKIELLLFLPFLIGLFCYYFYISLKEDSAVQKPEKLYQEKGLLIYCCVLCALFLLLLNLNLSWLEIFTTSEIIQFE